MRRRWSNKTITPRKRKTRTSLTIVFSICVFGILLAAIGFASFALFILVKTGVIANVDGELKLGTTLLIMSCSSVVIGGILAFTVSRIPLKPINQLIDKMNRLAEGDYKARIKFGNIMSSYPAFLKISSSFNKMAQELESTELLRVDFINNFSHEFKTPIVSIAGFAKLLSKDNLTDEERKSYAKAIEEESVRLSVMATNVLDLTKVENQSILTGVTRFNLSEQIRSAILLLEGKWAKKDIDLRIDFDEYEIEANEEQLKQVWINLFDNAVKFVPEKGIVELEIKEQDDVISVRISNTGAPIPKEKGDKIFNKFYQCDESHATKGNGIGLAIVKRIVELHSGEVSFVSDSERTAFTVVLPKSKK